MNPRRLILQGARHYWRTHLGVVLGAALATMVLTGSLLVGDSVKKTLRKQAELRVGDIGAALVGGDRFFRSQLAGSAPALLLRGNIVRTDGKARVNQAQVLGVDARFWKLAPQPSEELPQNSVGLNERAAAQLGVQVGDTVVLRVEKPGFFSKDAPLSGNENEVVAVRLPIGRIITDQQFGRFGLQASQIPPSTMFVPLELLQEKTGLGQLVNLHLLGSYLNPDQDVTFLKELRLIWSPSPRTVRVRNSPGRFRKNLRQWWQLADFSLRLQRLERGGFELRSPRVFLDPAVAAAGSKLRIQTSRNGSVAGPPGLESLTYLVNELRSGDKAVPYSMVTAVDAPSSGFLPAELSHDEIVINQWLADELGVGLNGRVTLKYFVMGERRQLTEKSREFEVIQILPMTEPQLNSSWMPDFPGLSDKENCRDWQPGFALDTQRIRDQDEAYWQQYRGTPKAFVNLTVGQEMWGNRWGNLTSIRYAAGLEEAELARSLLNNLTPESVGLSFVDLRAQALAATKAPVDFGQLFVSFSFFLIVAAAVLTGLLFVFSLEQRNAEAGLLLALGLRPRQVRRLFLIEGLVLALLGSLLGAAAAVAYTRLVLHALGSVWKGAVGAVQFEFASRALTLPIGIASGVLIAWLAMWLASRRQLRSSARELLTGEVSSVPFSPGSQAKLSRWLQIFPTAASMLAVALLVLGNRSAGAFFGAGALLLIAGLTWAWSWLRGLRTAAALGTINQLGVRNAARRRPRSLATIAVLASGVFMVVAVDSFRKTPPREGDTSDPGTGGFALVGESALPIYEDLNTAQGREAYGVNENTLRGVKVVPLRVREGDDASCLNLNRALQPRLLGVRPEDLLTDSKPRFRFTKKDASWSQLAAESGDAVPGIVDAATLQWALQKKIGDTLEYRDERGAPFLVRIVGAITGSILQGSVVISERHLIEKFPGAGGYRFLLIDAPPEATVAVRSELSRALTDRGLELTSTAARLAEFQAVENTYLSIFQALGGLGLLLGSAGLAIVVGRNVLERRREFGLLEAIGFRPRQLRQLV
ncbi:MAG TPA: FtsX-like permease family protein, partial [Chthoniobacteraceae bacterium]